jgi:innexin
LYFNLNNFIFQIKFLKCWVPMEFKGGWEQYAEDYCFIQNTYYVAPEEEIPIEVTERDERQFGYYQVKY